MAELQINKRYVNTAELGGDLLRQTSFYSDKALEAAFASGYSFDFGKIAFENRDKDLSSIGLSMNDYGYLSGLGQITALETAFNPELSDKDRQNNLEYLRADITNNKNKEIHDNTNDFVKFLGTVGASIGNFFVEFYGAFEGILDAGATIINALANDDTITEWIAKDKTGYKKAKQDLEDFNAKYTFINDSVLAKGFYDIHGMAGNLAWVAVPMIGGGAALARNGLTLGAKALTKAVAKGGVKTANIASSVGRVVYWGSMYGHISSNAAQYSLKYDDTPIKGYALAGYAASVLGVEFLTEMLGGKLFGGSAIDRMVLGKLASPITKLDTKLSTKSAVGAWIYRSFSDVLGEGVEEMAAEWADGLLYSNMITGNPEDQASFSDILYAGILGGIMGGIMGGTRIGMTKSVSVTKDGEIIQTNLLTDEQKKNAVQLNKAQTILLSDSLGQLNKRLSKEIDYMAQAREGIISQENAIRLTEQQNTRLIQSTAGLSQFFGNIGVENFKKALDLTTSTIEQQAQSIRNFANRSKPETKLYKELVDEYNKAHPLQSVDIVDDPTIEAKQIQKYVQEKFGVNVLIMKTGAQDGIHEVVNGVTFNEYTIGFREEALKELGIKGVLNTIIAHEIAHTLQMSSGVITPKNLLEVKRILDDSGIKTTSVYKSAKLGFTELTEAQADAICSKLLFDDTVAETILYNNQNVFKKVFIWMKDFANRIKNGKNKTRKNYETYKTLVGRLYDYRQIVANNIGNVEDAEKFIEEFGLNEEERQDLLDTYLPTWRNQCSLTKYNINQEGLDKMSAVNFLASLRKNKTDDVFDFERAFDPEYYDTDAIAMITEQVPNSPFKEAVQSVVLAQTGYIISNDGWVIDARNVVTSLNDAFIDDLIRGNLHSKNKQIKYATLHDILNKETQALFIGKNGSSAKDVKVVFKDSVDDSSFDADYNYVTKTLTFTLPKTNVKSKARRFGFEQQLQRTVAMAIADVHSFFGGLVPIVVQQSLKQLLPKQVQFKKLARLILTNDFLSKKPTNQEIINAMTLRITELTTTQRVLDDISSGFVTDGKTIQGYGDFFGINFGVAGSVSTENAAVALSEINKQQLTAAFKKYNKQYFEENEHDPTKVVPGQQKFELTDKEVKNKTSVISEQEAAEYKKRVAKNKTNKNINQKETLEQIPTTEDDLKQLKDYKSGYAVIPKKIFDEDGKNAWADIEPVETLSQAKSLKAHWERWQPMPDGYTIVDCDGYKIINDKTETEPTKQQTTVKKSEPIKKPEQLKKVEPVKKPEQLKKVESVKKPEQVKKLKKSEPVKKTQQVKKVETKPKQENVTKKDLEEVTKYFENKEKQIDSLSKQNATLTRKLENLQRGRDRSIQNREKLKREIQSLRNERVDAPKEVKASSPKAEQLAENIFNFKFSKTYQSKTQKMEDLAKENKQFAIGSSKEFLNQYGDDIDQMTDEDVLYLIDFYNNTKPKDLSVSAAKAFDILFIYLKFRMHSFSPEVREKLMGFLAKKENISGSNLSTYGDWLIEAIPLTALEQQLKDAGIDGFKIPDTMKNRWRRAVQSGDYQTQIRIENQTKDMVQDALENAKISKNPFAKGLTEDERKRRWSLFIEKVNALRYLAMLSNPATHIRNIISNVGITALTRTAEAFETLVDKMIQWNEGDLKYRPDEKVTKEEMSYVEERYGHIIDAVASVGKYDERDTTDAGHIMSNARRDTIFKSKFFKGLQTLIYDKSLSKFDVKFSRPALIRALTQLLKANYRVEFEYDMHHYKANLGKYFDEKRSFEDIIEEFDIAYEKADDKLQQQQDEYGDEITEEQRDELYKISEKRKQLQALHDYKKRQMMNIDIKDTIVLRALFEAKTKEDAEKIIKEYKENHPDVRSLQDVNKNIEDGVTMQEKRGVSQERLGMMMEVATRRVLTDYLRYENRAFLTWCRIMNTNPALKLLGSIIIPFAKVVTNMTILTWRYSGITLFRGIWNFIKYAKMGKKLPDMKFTSSEKAWIYSLLYGTTDPRFLKAQSAADIGTGSIGVIILLVGVILNQLGIIDEDDDDQYTGYVIRIGDYQFKLSDLSPAITPLLGGAAISKAFKDGGDLGDAMGKYFTKITDQTLYGAFNGIFDTYGTSLLDKGASLIQTYLTQYIPAIFRSLQKVTNDKPQLNYQAGWFNVAIQRVLSALPIVSGLALPSKIDEYTGENVQAYNSKWLAALNIFLPITISKDKTNPIRKEAQAIGAETGVASGSFTINDTQYKLTGADKEVMQRNRAKYIQSLSTELINDKIKVRVQQDDGSYKELTYSQMSDEQKQAALKSTYSKATNYAKIEYWVTHGHKYYATTKDEYNKLKTLGINVTYKPNAKGSKYKQ